MATLLERANQYIDENRQRFIDQIVEMAKIPAPSNHEELRAKYCKEYMESFGAKGVYIDEALNVVYPYHAEGCNELVVIMGHSDVVFPDTTELPIKVEGDKIMGPGVTLIDSGREAARALKTLLTERDLLSDAPQGDTSYFVSDTVDGFEAMASLFLRSDLKGMVQQINIEKY